MVTRIRRSVLVSLAILLPWATWTWCAQQTDQKAKTEDGGAWGKPVDGLVCRLTLQPRYAVGQAISGVIEIKNTSNKKRFIIQRLHPAASQYLPWVIDGPNGKVAQTWEYGFGGDMHENWFEAIAPGEIKRIEIVDLRMWFGSLDPLSRAEPDLRDPVATGKFTARLRFRSPAVPKQFTRRQYGLNGKDTA